MKREYEIIYTILSLFRQSFQVAQTIKNSLAMQETWVRSLDWEDSPETGMATHSNIFAWRIPWTKEPRSLWGHKELDTTERLTLSLFFQVPSTKCYKGPISFKFCSSFMD